MALHLGNSGKLKIYLNGVAYRLDAPSSFLILNGAMLLSSDNFILKDSRGVYLTAKEDE